MKLLIVDDEELTRTGVISSIDWQSIGIQEVLQADDGINGIEMARYTDRTLYYAMCVCPVWMESQCWNSWKKFFLILFLFL